MPRDAFPHVSIFARMRGRLSLAYTELQYWLLGLTHESYHLHQAGVWADLHRYERAISHLKRYLAVTENVTARSELAFYHSCLQSGQRPLRSMRKWLQSGRILQCAWGTQRRSCVLEMLRKLKRSLPQ
jgi:hypothetical protein